MCLVVPGVEKDTGVTKKIITFGRKEKSIAPLTFFKPEWDQRDDKVGRLLDTIADLRKDNSGYPIALFSISAGGSLSLTAAHECPDSVSSIILTCSRLKMGYFELDSQERVLNEYPAHAGVVTFFEEKIEPDLSSSEREKCLTMIPDVDDVVPVQTMPLKGARSFNIKNTTTHVEGISSAYSNHSQIIIDFLNRGTVK